MWHFNLFVSTNKQSAQDYAKINYKTDGHQATTFTLLPFEKAESNYFFN